MVHIGSGWFFNSTKYYQKNCRRRQYVYIRLKIKNQFFASRLSLGAGWKINNPSYSTGSAGFDIHPKRLIGALNIDTNEDPDSFDRRSYHSSEVT